MRLLSVLAAAVIALCACTAPAPPATPTTQAPAPVQSPPRATPSRSGFIALGDFGTASSAQRAVAEAMGGWADAGHRVDALVSTGDNVYPDGDPHRFDEAIDQPYARWRGSIWATLGNHDEQNGNGPDQLTHLALPELPYARRLAGAQVLFLDANRPDLAQARWLDEQLSAPGPRFRIVVFHQPAWSCSEHGSTPAVDRLWVPVIERHRVALVLNGHDHNYQRFVSPGGVTYVVTGGGGAALYALRACHGTPGRVAAAVRHHFTAVEITKNTLTLTAVDQHGKPFDRAVIQAR
ncbi:metallophosphoesterase family protein [Nonomuraea sp. NPDC050536]|uniref:metallophosphoesterase family protein n=1 Tax=Nonomuraea sp. NPDC050536 TaxID=3364366 RepID=UPI0037CB4489